MKSMSNRIQSLGGKSATPSIPPRVFQAVIKIKIMHLNKPQLLKEPSNIESFSKQYSSLITSGVIFQNSFQLSSTTCQAPYLANQGFSNKLVKVGKDPQISPLVTRFDFNLPKLSFLFPNVTWCHQWGGCLERKGTIKLFRHLNYRSVIKKLSYYSLLIRCNLEVLPHVWFSVILNPTLLKKNTTGGLFCI